MSDDGHPCRARLAFTLTTPGPAASAPTAAPAVAPAAAPTAQAGPRLDGGRPAGEQPAQRGCSVWPWLVGAVILVAVGAVVALRLGRRKTASVEKPSRGSLDVRCPRGATWTGRSPARTPARPRCGRCSRATTVVAAVLAGALSSTTLPALLGTSLTRAGADVAGVACVGLALVGVLLPVGAPRRTGCAGARTARSSPSAAPGW